MNHELREWARLLLFTSSFFCVHFSLTEPQVVWAAGPEDERALQPRCDQFFRGTLSVDQVQNLVQQQSAQPNPPKQRVRDAALTQGVYTTALNQKIIREHNPQYSVRIPRGKTKNQKQTGRCWIFAGCHVLESQLIAEKKVEESFRFSESYLYFFSLFEKSNSFFEMIIRNRSKSFSTEQQERMHVRADLSDSGEWEWFLFLVENYGLVPYELMPDSINLENSAALIRELNYFLSYSALLLRQELSDLLRTNVSPTSEEALIALRTKKMKFLEGVMEILVTHLGMPPLEGFTVRSLASSHSQSEEGKELSDSLSGLKSTVKNAVIRSSSSTVYLTPQNYAKNFVGFEREHYVTVTYNPNQPLNRVYELEGSGMREEDSPKSTSNLRLLNLDLQRLKALTVQSIDQGVAVWFAADIQYGVHHPTGIMHPKVYQWEGLYDYVQKTEFRSFTQRGDRQYLSMGSGNHAMVFTGYDRPDVSGEFLKFQVLNSWGTEVGTEGVYHMYSPWFDEYVYEVVILKQFLSPEELALWEKGPTKTLPYSWYY